jgi:hypothetical protein
MAIKRKLAKGKIPLSKRDFHELLDKASQPIKKSKVEKGKS